MYHVGQRFINTQDNAEYMLTFMHHDEHKCYLANVICGFAYKEIVSYVEDPCNITNLEFDIISGYQSCFFTPITSPELVFTKGSSSQSTDKPVAEYKQESKKITVCKLTAPADCQYKIDGQMSYINLCGCNILSSEYKECKYKVKARISYDIPE